MLASSKQEYILSSRQVIGHCRVYHDRDSKIFFLLDERLRHKRKFLLFFVGCKIGRMTRWIDKFKHTVTQHVII